MSYGLVDIEKFLILQKDHPDLRVFIDGMDITDRCRWANDETGEAYVYMKNLLGQSFFFPFTGQIAMELLKGKVEFRDTHNYDKDLEDFRRWML